MILSGQITNHKPTIGIIGGSGMCSFPELTELYKVYPQTKYGHPSDQINVCTYANQIVAFLPRHGSAHSIAPHKVPYKANLMALKELGVETVFSTCIVGSLKKEIPPGSIVVPDQFVNMTWGRDDYVDADTGSFIHLPMADPYCETTRANVIKAIKDANYSVIEQGTVVVIQGPRFSTKAESKFFINNGWDIVNMTQYPECYLARELGICYATLATVTDYDVGVPSNLVMEPKHMDEILCVFRENIMKTKSVIMRLLENSPDHLSCQCSRIAISTYYEQK